jgi:branched-chain amino acid transport system substrate-binding protein
MGRSLLWWRFDKEGVGGMQRSLALLSLLVLQLSWNTHFSWSQDRALIGAVLPLSGGDANVWGESVRDGMLLALEDANKEPGVKLELAFEDDHCDPKSAVSAFRNLTEIKGAKVIIGAVCSSATMAIASLAERAKVLLLAPCSEADAISGAGDYVFRTYTPAHYQALTLAGFAAKKLSLKKVAILSIQNDYGESLRRAFTAEFSKLGGEVSLSEEYSPSTSDLRASLLRIKSRKPEALVMFHYPSDGVLAVKQAHEIGLRVPILGSSNMNNADFLQGSGSLSEGSYFADLLDSTRPDYIERFTAKYNRPWPGYSVCPSLGYDALKVLAAGIKQVGYDPAKLKDYLYALKNFPGVTGPINFNQDGDLIREHHIYVIRSGKSAPID